MLSPESWQPALDEFIKKFATSFVVPCMERKVRTLHGENTALGLFFSFISSFSFNPLLRLFYTC